MRRDKQGSSEPATESAIGNSSQLQAKDGLAVRIFPPGSRFSGKQSRSNLGWVAHGQGAEQEAARPISPSVWPLALKRAKALLNFGQGNWLQPSIHVCYAVSVVV